MDLKSLAVSALVEEKSKDFSSSAIFCETPINKKTNSVGVILCRRATPPGGIEILMIRKRYTYAFAEFVNGKYSIRTNAQRKKLTTMFNRMTIQELLNIMSLDFSKLWYHVWLS